MCGIAGVVARSGGDVQELLERANIVQKHRGPDSSGSVVVQSGEWQVGLAHTRLAIIDLSDAGAQPLRSRGGSWLCYNGEIYNHLELRSDLSSEGGEFRSDCDTEVLAQAIEAWGLEEALRRSNGMWAFAWLDQDRRKLYLVRDRLGKKPLQYWISEDQLIFASEVKAIVELVGRRFALDVSTTAAYLGQSLLCASERTFFSGIRRVPAGHYVVIDLQSTIPKTEIVRYWRAPVGPNSGDAPVEDLIERLRDTFVDSVALRLRADVPVGVLLSGGVDSSAIAAATCAIREGHRVKFLSAVSSDGRFDESRFVDSVSDHLRVEPLKFVFDLSPSDAIERLGKATWHNDEPLGSFSTIAHMCLMEQAKEAGITVLLSGQGADELLCGYRKYLGFYLQRLVRTGKLATATRVFGEFLARGTVLNQFSFQDAKRYLPSLFVRSVEGTAGDAIRDQPRWDLGLGEGTLNERQRLDLEMFSVPVLTHYEDRMSMASSREIRLPFLDYRLVELLLPLPPELKLRDGWTKWLLRRAMEPLMPSDVVWRKDKQHFANPQSEWLKGSLSGEVERTFCEDALIFRWKLVNRPALMSVFEQYRKQPVGRGRYSFKDVFGAMALEVFLRRFESYLSPP